MNVTGKPLSHARLTWLAIALASLSLLPATAAFAILPIQIHQGNSHEGLAAGPDGGGGAFIVWEENRSGTSFPDLYVQHFLPSNSVDPAWPAGGVLVTGAPDFQTLARVVPDGSGGAYVSWYDLRDQQGGSNSDIYAQHVMSGGAVDPTWPADGLAICTAVNFQQPTDMIADGNGGAFVCWNDYRANGQLEQYVDHLLPAGLDPAWPADGLLACGANGEQGGGLLVRDGSGGTIIAWTDQRGNDADIYARRVAANGTLVSGWGVNGRLLSGSNNDETLEAAVSDGAGGIVAVWSEISPTADVTLHAQRAASTGAIATGWASGGVSLCGTADTKGDIHACSDGAGGAFVSWRDERLVADGGSGAYLQRVASTGALAAGWPANGIRLSSVRGLYPVISDNGGTGCYVSWIDDSGHTDFFSPFTSLRTASGSVAPNWPPEGAQLGRDFMEAPSRIAQAATGLGRLVVTWALDYNQVRLMATTFNATDQLGVADGLRPGSSWLASPTPDPASGPAALSFELAREARVRIVVFDAGGRLVRVIADRWFASGHHSTAWNLRDSESRPVRSGLYLVTLEAEGRRQTQRLAVIR